MGWPDPIYIFSGNGFYLIFRVSLQNNAEDRLLVKHFLYGMDYQFSNVSGAAKVDTSVGNPSRIIRIPGTFNRKGNPSQHRPHRQCRIISLPSPMVAVSREQMEAVVNEVNCPRCFAVQSTGLDPQAIADLKLGGSSDAISRCVAYVGKVIATATGQHKQVESLRMAPCCYEFGLSTEEATVIMRSLNAHRSPGDQLDEAKIAHKLSDALKWTAANGRIGCKLRYEIEAAVDDAAFALGPLTARRVQQQVTMPGLEPD